MEGMASPLVAWESFYVIVGSSAAALTGLQFVVIVLGAEVNAIGERTTRAFGTPTVVHFCAVLFISAVLSAPWPAFPGIGLVIGTLGAIGVVYVLTVIRHARRQSDYVPVFEDWMCHGVLPLIAYAGLLVAGIVLARDPVPTLFVIGAAAVLLLFVGIHNAWDAVTFVAHKGRSGLQPAKSDQAEKKTEQ
jgi:hypothetical protein